MKASKKGKTFFKKIKGKNYYNINNKKVIFSFTSSPYEVK
jgi:hypothetical protein